MGPKPPKAPPLPQTPRIPKLGRMGLGAYTEDPASFPPSVVIYHTDDFVVIHDKFPKATVHTLLLTRSKKHHLLHPFEAFKDAEFLAKVQAEVAKLKTLVAKELQRKIGADSQADAKREAILNGETEAVSEDLPKGRDWESEIIAGVHAVPSMSHLHVHVLSRDMHSPCVKHRKHFNSFNTPFLVDVGEFPLGDADLRWDTRKEKYLEWDLVCWRCSKNFGNKFAQLKAHLDEEFERWRIL